MLVDGIIFKIEFFINLFDVFIVRENWIKMIWLYNGKIFELIFLVSNRFFIYYVFCCGFRFLVKII